LSNKDSPERVANLDHWTYGRGRIKKMIEFERKGFEGSVLRRLKVQVDDLRLIAPCGLNCSLCRVRMRKRHPCPGCRGDDRCRSKARSNCAIKKCKERTAGGHEFCFSCPRFPCVQLRHLEGRYRSKYKVSVVGNLKRIRAVGVEHFVAEEKGKWACGNCGALICMHKPQCVNCGHAWRGEAR
jgi:hypothetical protein